MIAHVIPTMDQINMMLSSSSTELLLPFVKHALSFMWKIMDKYYWKMDFIQTESGDDWDVINFFGIVPIPLFVDQVTEAYSCVILAI